ncbi:MAG: SxtJ family membrane protein [Chloroflexi bacterium]|nr:SxtJ family membrane protein [Chloroflexota bacterium]
MKNERSENRKFGLVLGAAFILLGALLYWREKSFWPYIAAFGALLIISGLLIPGLLGPVRSGWMAFAHFIGTIMTSVIMFIMFYLVVTPIAIVYRLFNHDPLKLKFDPGTKSYWIKREHAGIEPSRYKHQF